MSIYEVTIDDGDESLVIEVNDDEPVVLVQEDETPVVIEIDPLTDEILTTEELPPEIIESSPETEVVVIEEQAPPEVIEIQQIEGPAGQPGAPGDVGNLNVEEPTLTALQIAAKQITLEFTPADPTEVVVNVFGGPIQKYAVDYIVTGNILSWNGLGLETTLAEGDELHISYLY